MKLECQNEERSIGHSFSSFGFRRSFNHVAPAELEFLIDDQAINVALLTELQLMEDWDFIENVTDETNYAHSRMQRGSR